MNAKQMDLFEYLKTQSRTEDPAPMLALLGAVDGIRHNKFKVSAALESVALILEGTPEKLPKKHEAFVFAIGKAIKPVLAQVKKTARPNLAREVSDFYRLAEDGHPVTIED